MEILKPPLDLAGYGILSISTGRTKMPDEVPPPTLDTELTTNIVAAYVRHNQIGADQLSVLISTVHLALVGVGKSGNPFTAIMSSASIVAGAARCSNAISRPAMD
jgi:ROS/MUCR transcriptional regulator protein